MIQDKEDESDDPIEEAKAVGKDRLKNPFYFSLIVSFAAANWKAIYFLLWPSGDLDAEARLNWIAGNLYECWPWALCKVLVIPIGVACLYVAVIPKYLYILEAQRHRARRMFERKKEAIDEDVTKIRLKVDLLKDDLALEKKTNADLNKKIGELQGEVENTKLQAQQQVAAAKGHADQHILEYLRKDSNLKTTLQRLRKGGNPSSGAVQQFLMSAGFIEAGDGKWYLTDSGKSFAEKFPE